MASCLPASELFVEQVQGDSLSCCPADGNTDDLESVDTPSSDNSDNRAWHLAQAVALAPTGRDNAIHLSKPTVSPQFLSPPLFVSWNHVANLVAVHKDIESCPHDELHTALDRPKCMFPGEKKLFLAANGTLSWTSSKTRSCPWNESPLKCFKPCTRGNRPIFFGILSCKR